MYISTPYSKIESLAGNRFQTDCFKLMLSDTLELPTIANIAAKISRKVNDKKANFTTIAEAILVDPVISAQVVKVANGSKFQDQKKVASCTGALTRIGIKAAQRIISSFVLNSSFTASSPVIDKRLNNLWTHSNYVAAISAKLALMTPGFDPDRAMLGGLLHDIGMIPILIHADKNQEVLDYPTDLDQTIRSLKNEIGIQIIRKWGLPPEFEDMVSHSENWFLNTETKPNYTDIIIIAQLHSYIGAHQMKNLPKLDELPGYKKLANGQLDADTSIRIIDAAKEEVQQTITLLD